MGILDRVREAWNAFRNLQPETQELGRSNFSYTTASPSKTPLRGSNEKSIIASIYTRLAIDVSGIPIKHVTIDEQERYSSDKETPLGDCLKFEPNIDQSPRAFRQDIAMTLFDTGVAVVVPVDTSRNPQTNELFEIFTLRVGKVVTWYPKHVRVSIYNEETGLRQEITLEKKFVAIIENPLYDIMNQPNSTLQRLIRKLNLLDAIDEQSASGKLDIIIQLPYVIKSEARRLEAETRRKDIEFQLKGSQYGVAYIDGTEKVTQLNRPAENNLLAQVEYLTTLLYNQLGLTEEVMNGKADEPTMIHYINRTIEPILDAIIESMQRAFLGPQGTQNNERIMYFRNPFKLVPISQIAEIADKFARNEILSSNEIRSAIGIKPSDDPNADKLQNSNMPQPGITQHFGPVQQQNDPANAGAQPLERNSQNGT